MENGGPKQAYVYTEEQLYNVYVYIYNMDSIPYPSILGICVIRRRSVRSLF